MREATPEELKSVSDYVKSISYNPIVKELEKLKSEMVEKYKSDQYMDNYTMGVFHKFIDNRIKELKGENNEQTKND